MSLYRGLRGHDNHRARVTLGEVVASSSRVARRERRNHESSGDHATGIADGDDGGPGIGPAVGGVGGSPIAAARTGSPSTSRDGLATCGSSVTCCARRAALRGGLACGSPPRPARSSSPTIASRVSPPSCSIDDHRNDVDDPRETAGRAVEPDTTTAIVPTLPRVSRVIPGRWRAGTGPRPLRAAR